MTKKPNHHKPAQKPDPEPDKAEENIETLVRAIHRQTVVLTRLAEMLEKITRPPVISAGNLIGPSQEPGGDQEFISGQWHRRAGDIYGRVAEPGSPNAGVGDANEPHRGTPETGK